MYNTVVIGGTFDHLHEGHKAFLRFAFQESKEVLIGVTSDRYAAAHKEHISYLQTFSERQEVLKNFLANEGVLSRATIAQIDSVLYPKEWENLQIDAIIVTENTVKGARHINEDRKKKGLPALDVVVAPLLQRHALSSTAIRERLSVDVLFSQTLILPENERGWFRKPFGTLLVDPESTLLPLPPDHIFTVGDVITKYCNRRKIGQILSVIDMKVQRKPSHTTLSQLGFSGDEITFNAVNPPAHLTTELTYTLQRVLVDVLGKRRCVLQVEGEEDLAVLPLTLMAPVGFHIFYGQPNEGVVHLEVSHKTKQEAAVLIEKFTYDTRGY